MSINGKNEDIHAFICQLQNVEGCVCLGIWIVECGHKIGLNGVDNGLPQMMGKLVVKKNYLVTVVCHIDLYPAHQNYLLANLCLSPICMRNLVTCFYLHNLWTKVDVS